MKPRLIYSFVFLLAAGQAAAQSDETSTLYPAVWKAGLSFASPPPLSREVVKTQMENPDQRTHNLRILSISKGLYAMQDEDYRGALKCFDDALNHVSGGDWDFPPDIEWNILNEKGYAAIENNPDWLQVKKDWEKTIWLTHQAIAACLYMEGCYGQSTDMFHKVILEETEWDEAMVKNERQAKFMFMKYGEGPFSDAKAKNASESLRSDDMGIIIQTDLTPGQAEAKKQEASLLSKKKFTQDKFAFLQSGRELEGYECPAWLPSLGNREDQVKLAYAYERDFDIDQWEGDRHFKQGDKAVALKDYQNAEETIAKMIDMPYPGLMAGFPTAFLNRFCGESKEIVSKADSGWAKSHPGGNARPDEANAQKIKAFLPVEKKDAK